MSKRICYIAGPMSGIPNWNYDAFNAAAYQLSREGWDVRNPAAKDQEMGYDQTEAKATGDTKRSIEEGVFNFREAFEWDIKQILNGDAIYMLKGWEASPGACAEHATAVVMRKNYPDYKIMYQ
jgi:hypothetical protein